MGAIEEKDVLGQQPRKLSMDESAASTLGQSHEPSVMEKTEPAVPDVDDENKDAVWKLESDEPVVVEKTEVDLNRAVSNISQEPEEFPGRMKLILITVALCLSVFCMALVCSYDSTFRQGSRG